MKKLFQVRFEGDVYVMAEDSREALREAEQAIHEEIGNFTGKPYQAHKFERFGAEVEGSLPYNGADDEEKTIGQILQEMREGKG